MTRCAEGASKNDPEYKELKSLQDRGDRLKQNNSASYERMAKYQSEGLFGYGKYDKVNDWITRNEREAAIAKAISEIGTGSVAIGSGFTLCATGAGCALGAPIAGLGAANFGTGLSELVNQVRNGYNYKEGQGVLDSFSLDTHQGAYDPVKDLGISAGIDLGLGLGGLAGLKLGGKLARELGEKLGRGVKGYEKVKANDIKALPSLQMPNAGGAIVSDILKKDELFFRVFSGNNKIGRFLTKSPPTSKNGAIEGLALPPNNQADFIQEVLVPAGTRLQRSRALPAFGRGGGKEQFELLDNILDENFKVGKPLQ